MAGMSRLDSASRSFSIFVNLDDLSFHVQNSLQGKYISVASEPDDLSERDGGDDRMAAEIFAGMDVAQVHLDDRQADADERVAKGNRIMRQPTGVDHDRVRPLAMLLDRI